MSKTCSCLILIAILYGIPALAKQHDKVQNNDSIKLAQRIKHALLINRTHPDSAYVLYTGIIKDAQNKKSIKNYYRALFGLSKNFEKTGCYKKSDSLLINTEQKLIIENDTALLIEYYIRRSSHLGYNGMLDSAMALSDKNIQLSKNYSGYMSRQIILEVASVCFNCQKYKYALNYYLNELKKLHPKDSRYQMILYERLGMTYFNMKYIEKSLEYYTKSVQMMDSLGLTYTDILYGVGVCNFQLKDYEKAYVYFKQAVENKNEEWSYRYVGRKSYLCYWQCCIYLNKPNHYRIGMDFIKGMNKKNAHSYMKAEIYIYYNMLDQAEDCLLKGVKEEQKLYDHIPLGYYSKLSDLYFVQGEYKKALEYYKLFKTSEDSIVNEKVQHDFLELQEKYKASEREAKIANLNSQVEKEKLETRLSKSRFKVFSIVFIVVLIIASAIVYYYRNRQKLRIIKLKAENEKKEHEMQNIMQESKTNILQSNLKGQEKERSRIAKELHDDLGGRLSALRYFISSKKYRFENEDKTLLKNELKDIQRYVRNLSHQLAKPQFLNVTLPQLIEEQKFWINNSDINFNFDFDPEIIWETIPEGHQTQMYRIVQEAVSNSLKHANASEIGILITQNPDSINITVSDNGIGISNASGKGAGLKNMKGRAELFNAKIRFVSLNNHGTKMLLSYPVYNAKAQSEGEDAQHIIY